MSDLRKSFAQAKLSSFPTFDFNETDEEVDEGISQLRHEYDSFNNDDDCSSGSSASTCTIKPNQHQIPYTRPQVSKPSKTLAPIPWTDYFERELYIQSSTASTNITHHAYLTSQFGSAPLFVTHHGAGSSGLSFALLWAEIQKQLPSAGILSIDARGHGLTNTTSQREDINLSLGTLSEDLILILDKTKNEMQWKEMPPLVLIGHSLGGAVVTEVSKSGKLDNHLLGYVVIDVVEGSAMDALKGMQAYLTSRPVEFSSLECGIEWHLQSRTLRNPISARISVPALLTQTQQNEQISVAWTWRTNLVSTMPFWESWFAGLSKKFLEGKAGKLLLLAGTDRLDTELMIGQMQGKYAMEIFPDAGHFIHEDQPERAAHCIVQFYKRNDRSLLILPPKVADLQRAGKKV